MLAEIGDGPHATLLNYGHPAPLVVRPNGAVAFAAPPDRALPLGLTLDGSGTPLPYEVPFAPATSCSSIPTGSARPAMRRATSTVPWD